MWGVGNGRVVAGVHYRSDTIASLKLGEQVAIELLRDYLHTFNEPFVGWTFRDVEGATVNIKA
jgi:membrane-associated phospholipid phosphatase